MRITVSLGVALLGYLLVQPAGTEAQGGGTVATNPSSAQSGPMASAGSARAAGVVSEVRIVRLSQVKGVVQLDRNIGRGYEEAFANIPITRGTRLRTGNGLAEVEFEDNSTLRITPYSVVSFQQLGRNAAGATITAVQLADGTAYVKLAKTKGNEFTLSEGKTNIELLPGSHVRLEARTRDSELAVFDGEAQIAMAPDAPEMVGKKQSVVFDPAAQVAAAAPERKIEAAVYDDWDKSQVDYHAGAVSFAGTSGSVMSNSMYGANDLNYYGSFSNLPGCGMMWRPYFASAGWDPFANGMWALYPGAGYSWVSPYPWGWLPYHSGSWQNCGSAGWGWQPGSQFYGLGNGMLFQSAGLTAPGTGAGVTTATLIPVNKRPLTMSGLQSQEGSTFVFRKDSAGLGVPRGTFGKLDGTSAAVDRHQTVSTGVTRQPLGFSQHQVGGAPGQAFPGHGMNQAGSPEGVGSHSSGNRSGDAVGYRPSASAPNYSGSQTGHPMSSSMPAASMPASAAPAASSGAPAPAAAGRR